MSERLERARSFGPARHAGQRYGDAPHETHLAAVEAVRRRFGVSDEDVLVAAHLHDVVEDTDTTLTEVEAEFGARVAWIVDHVTNRPG